ncbi:pyridoxal-phosphate dependent enzyme [Pseudomonas fontis]|uniref:L-serine ammonia-lyase n=1 Tax=Pseudomonas fontis TaxID=2942633 RepID=A0ABT5NWD6_9PSED|nr:pyridoxal-phosphate dependent enzyme [Pseudomonas fontis]MDD0976215.1 pyridoxal-phosphate dependent enzyme [Pseudomonas fontis]MDD0992491.1 pyridoxal-phosphate dependent enzyme [Pseudomonas fontis]
MSLHLQTPLIASRPLSLASGQEVWLKLDALQPSGSFKLRGIGLACETFAKQGKRRFVSSSGGNAGIAVAYAGRCLGIPVTIVVPQTTTERARQLIAQENAEVIVHGATWHEANELALSLLGGEDAFIHPFDDPLLWQGHSTMIDEVAAAGFKPDAVVLSVGGGGLFAGVCEGMARQGWDDVPVFAVETAGAASLAAAMAQKQRVALDSVKTYATSLAAKQVCQRAFELSQSRPVISHVLSDGQALEACERFLSDHRILVEPACGAALALAYAPSSALKQYEKVLVVVCGGVTATLDQIREWRAVS